MTTEEILTRYKKDKNLRGADLSRADLSGANLSGAYLSRAYLSEADLSGAYLRGANLSRANLSEADLSGTYLRGANLSGANLSGADLSGAILSGAILSGANLSGAEGLFGICPQVGSFTAFKKLRNGIICKLQVTETSGRVGGWTQRKCRCEEVIVTEGEGISIYDENFSYKVGETIKIHNWNPDPREVCASGIHFYLTREEAEANV